jgi:uncharacterized protein YdhG (YjbR/CyaY superfamily)
MSFSGAANLIFTGYLYITTINSTHMKSTHAENIDAYIAEFPKDTQKILKELRATIKKAAPKAEEAIKYAIPTFVLNGNLVHFAAYKSHIGFYPAPMGIEAFKEETAPYEAGKGTLQFPLDKPIPLNLITKIVKFRVEQNMEKVKAKQKK